MKQTLCIAVLCLFLIIFVAGCLKAEQIKATVQPAMPPPSPTLAQEEASPLLNGLQVFVTEGGGGTLQPQFSPKITNYNLNVQSDISFISLLPVVQDEQTQLTALGQEVTSGHRINAELKTGQTKIDLHLANKSGKETVYRIIVEREDLSSVVNQFLPFTYTDKKTGRSMNYRLFIPAQYDEKQQYPLVLFLHGAGERGGDNLVQLTASQGATVWAKSQEQAKQPCFVLAPQASAQGGWTSLMFRGFSDPYEPEPELAMAYSILKQVMRDYSVDKSRVYATGVSMGGYGVWALAALHPDDFAAIVPVCGGGDPNQTKKLRDIPVWAFHAELDNTVPVGFSDNMVQALKDAGGEPRYTRYSSQVYFYPSAHLSWVPAYADVNMRRWLFEQKKLGDKSYMRLESS